jgi:peptide/nickel transport system substrate-binding protein
LATGVAAGAMAAGLSIAPGMARAAPKKGGTLRLGIGHGSTTDSLDPATFENLYMQTVGAACYNKLTEVGNTGELLPEAAESWDVSPDAKTWTFKLRKGVEFHNGKTMDSADVVASIQPEDRQRRLPLHHQRLSPRDYAVEGRQGRRYIGHRFRQLCHR